MLYRFRCLLVFSFLTEFCKVSAFFAEKALAWKPRVFQPNFHPSITLRVYHYLGSFAQIAGISGCSCVARFGKETVTSFGFPRSSGLFSRISCSGAFSCNSMRKNPIPIGCTHLIGGANSCNAA